MAAGLADGVPARGDPAAARLRRVRDPRSVDHRGAHRRHGRARVPERVPPPGRQGRRRAAGRASAGSRARSTAGATALDGNNTFVPRAKSFSEHNLQPDDINLTPVRCEVWGGCAWINLDDDAPPLRQCIEPYATILDAWKVESLRTEWWYACRLPVNWKLAEAAFMEQYHVVETHPQLRIAGRYAPPRRRIVRPAGVRRCRHPLPAHDERRHGRDGARERRADRRRAARHRAPRRPGARDVDVAARAQRRGRAVAPRRGPRHPRPRRARGARARRADGLLLPALLRAAHVQQRVRVPIPAARTGRDADGDLVADPVPGRKRAAEAHAARAVGVRRSALAADPRAGLLQPAAAAEGAAREGLRVHAPVGAGRGRHLELRTDRRRLPRRPAVREAAPRAAVRST